MKNKPAACTKPVWEELIPKENRTDVLFRIREQSLEHHGEALDACPKRKTCFTTHCTGRPLPVKSDAFKPYMEQLRQDYKIEGGLLFIDNCETCKVANTCSKPCAQINDFIKRESDPEVTLYYQASLEKFENNTDTLENTVPKAIDLPLPWEVLTPRKAEVIKKYLYAQKDYNKVAKELGLSSKDKAKYEFYSALTKLSEYGNMRKFLKEKGQNLTIKQQNVLNMVYFGNMSLTNVAKEVKISKQAVTDIIKRVIANNNIKWTIFVKKEGNKVVYNIPELLK